MNDTDSEGGCAGVEATRSTGPRHTRLGRQQVLVLLEHAAHRLPQVPHVIRARHLREHRARRVRRARLLAHVPAVHIHLGRSAFTSYIVQCACKLYTTWIYAAAGNYYAGNYWTLNKWQSEHCITRLAAPIRAALGVEQREPGRRLAGARAALLGHADRLHRQLAWRSCTWWAASCWARGRTCSTRRLGSPCRRTGPTRRRSSSSAARSCRWACWPSTRSATAASSSSANRTTATASSSWASTPARHATSDLMPLPAHIHIPKSEPEPTDEAGAGAVGIAIAHCTCTVLQAVVNSVMWASRSAFIVHVVLLALRMPSSLVRVQCGGLTGMLLLLLLLLCSRARVQNTVTSRSLYVYRYSIEHCASSHVRAGGQAISSSTGHLYPCAALLIGSSTRSCTSPRVGCFTGLTSTTSPTRSPVRSTHTCPLLTTVQYNICTWAPLCSTPTTASSSSAAGAAHSYVRIYARTDIVFQN